MKRYQSFFPGAANGHQFGARIPEWIALNSARIPLTRQERGSNLIAPLKAAPPAKAPPKAAPPAKAPPKAAPPAEAPPKAAPPAKAPPKAAERKSARLAAPSATKMIEALIAA